MHKSRLLTFILSSLFPGSGFMYLGYMKKGMQYMVLFIMAAYLAYLTNAIWFDLITVFFALLLPVLWFYQLFDAMHTFTQLKKADIEMPTDDGFFFLEEHFTITPVKSRTIARVGAYVLILLGTVGIIYGGLHHLHYLLGWDTQQYILSIIRRSLVPMLASIALVVLGIKLLIGNKGKAPSGEDGDGGVR